MKTASLREVKDNLSRVIENLPKTGPMLIAKTGQTRAVLLAVDRGHRPRVAAAGSEPATLEADRSKHR
jgi:antitoxin (DNA-binding transcriptional repressor) of toxin-antitoxin stability system